MPFANLKVPAETLTPASKKQLQDAVTQAYVDVYGEGARSNVLVLIEEVTNDGWSLGGTVLNRENLGTH